MQDGLRNVAVLLIGFVLVLAFPSLLPRQANAQTGLGSDDGVPPVVFLASHADSPFRILAPNRSPRRARTATISVHYLAAGTTNLYGDSCLAWPANAQTAFSYALDIWGGLLNSAVPIGVNACWTSLDPGVLGAAGATGTRYNFAGAPAIDTKYVVALANALAGSDLNGGTAEIEAEFSNAINWYFGSDGSPGLTQYDFVSVVLHEVGHGLGFLGPMSVIGGLGSWGSSMSYAYDRFTENLAGQSLINTTLFPNPSVALGTQLTSGNVYFNGTNAKAANGGTRPKLYAPAVWNWGSSYVHLDTIYDGTANALMTFSLNNGEAIHDPGPITLGIFKDLGWPQGQPGTLTPTRTATPTATSTATSTRTPTGIPAYLPFITKASGANPVTTPAAAPTSIAGYQLLPNGDFEQGVTLWATRNGAYVVNNASLARGGSWLALLGGSGGDVAESNAIPETQEH